MKAKRKEFCFMASRLTDVQRTRILEKYDYLCVYCMREADSVDHIIPWSYLHDSNDENLVACCMECNLIAGDKVFFSFAEKYQYIDRVRKHRRKRKTELSICTDCGNTFKPRAGGSTLFLCKTCAELAKLDPTERWKKQPIPHEYREKLAIRRLGRQ
jgi:hypothetical protein